MDGPASSRLEHQLSEHGGWLRTLARELVRDRDQADELVQETWLAALRRPPRDGAAWRPWLRTVARTLALRRWRRPVAAQLTEEPPSADATSPAELCERLETGRILIEELEALEYRHRRALVLRYFDGLDARAIGERTGEPAGTVRWRLHEGLALLRKRLDARHGGDRPTWCRGLALSLGTSSSLPPSISPHSPRASTSPSTASLASSTGVLLVNSATKIAIAAAALVGVSTGLYLWIDGPEPEPQVELGRGERSVEPLVLAASDAALAAVATTAPERARSALTASEVAATSAPAAAVRMPARVEARALDASLLPIPDAHLAWIGDPVSSAAGRGDGTLVLDLAPREGEEDLDFAVSAPGFATRFLRARMRPDATLFLGGVILAPGGSIAGRVFDSITLGLDGVEVIAARAMENAFGSSDFEAQREQGPRFEISAPRALSRADGSFRIDGIEAGVARLWARGADGRWNVSEPIDVEAGRETAGITLTIRDAEEQEAALAPIEGVVVDELGEPIAKAQIQVRFRAEGWSSSWPEHADEQGRFRIAVKERGFHDLVFRDPAKRSIDASLSGIAPGTRDLRVELAPARLVRLRVHDGERAIERYTVRVVSSEGRDSGLAAEGDVHDGGRASVQVPSYRFRYVVDAKGYWIAELGPYEPASVPEDLDVDLDPAPGVNGRVLVGGEPRAGARVRLHAKPRATQIEVNNYRATILPVAKAEATSDEHGAFALDLREDGRYVLLTDADGFARAELGPLELAAAQGVRDLEIALSTGGAIEGRVRMPPGRDVAGMIVAINRGDGTPRTQVVGPDGLFRFERLTPGPWEVRRVKEEFRSITSWATSDGEPAMEREIEPSCRVREGETTRHDLDLTDWKPAVLVLELSVNGQAARAWSATLWPSGESSVTGELPNGTTDADGRARIEVDDARAYDVTVRPPPESGSVLEVTFPAIALQGGDNPLARDLALGRLEGRVVGQRDAPLRYRPKAKAERPLALALDATGRFELRLVPVGPGVFERASGDAASKSWTEIENAVVAAGATVQIELR